ncbi:MAG TPA: hypothetical protein VG944_10255, partial [Fimbriimonas sp.]|nr:hypothetical protein [Fimbriimonas sp.]
IAPIDGGGMTLSLYPVELQPGKKCRLSVWAKAAPGTNPQLTFDMDPTDPQSTPSVAVTLDGEWRRYEAVFQLPAGKDKLRCMGGITLATKGIAWIDDIALTEGP